MKKLSKRMCIIRNSIDLCKKYTVLEGLQLLKETTKIKFIESVDAAVNLGIDTRKSDQSVSNNVIMPYGLGKKMRIAVFTQGDSVDALKKEGIELVGLDNLYNRIKSIGCNDLDIILASPDVMHIVGKLGSILGPKGLMPNPKLGTVSNNLVESVKNIQLGQVRYKNDKNGIIHAAIGKLSFDLLHLQKNLEALIISIKRVKPAQCKGLYIKKISISTTMGGSVLIDNNSLDVSVLN